MNKNFILFIGALLLFSPTTLAFAQEKGCVPGQQNGLTEYCLLAPLPLGGPNALTEKTTATQFIPGLFQLAIMLATGLAVLMIIWGGVQYMSTDAWGGKNDAKNTIWNAIMGLLLTLSAWLIINTINPGLLQFNLSLDPVKIEKNTNKPTGSTGAPGADGLQPSTTNAVAGLRTACNNCVIRITSTTGDSHDPNSTHYQGLAVDIGADANLTKYLTGQTTSPRACATYLKTLNGINSRFLWEPAGSTCGGAVPSTGDHWHMSVTP
jgi:hypothetical protein